MSPRRASPIKRRLPGGWSRLFLLAFAGAFLVVTGFGVLWSQGLTSPAAVRLRLSEPYRIATALAHRHDLVGEYLGTVRGFGALEGEVDGSGSGGWCEIKLWVHGSRRDGRLEARLVRRGGQWFWEWANLRLEDGELVALAVR